MMRTKRRYKKTDGILAYHAFQSFAPGEVTPEVAHEIGIKLAQELWGDRFEVVVSTHLNTNCIHNHFCLNSVSFKDGKKYDDNKRTYALMRDTSDNLCKEYNLSVIQNKKKINSIYENFAKSEVEKSSYCNNVKEDIDFAIEQAYNFTDFIGIMKKMNYEVINRSGKLSVRPSNRKRNIRIENAFGSNYTIAKITDRIFNTQSVRLPFPEVRTQKKKFKYKKTNVKYRVTGIRAIYFKYGIFLTTYPKKKKRILSKQMREEIKKMDRISKEARFLDKNKIQTLQELSKYKQDINSKIADVKSKREYLWKKRKKSKTDSEYQEITEQIKQVGLEIKEIKEQQLMIEEIENRIPVMKENMQMLEEKDQQKQKEEQEKNRERRN